MSDLELGVTNHAQAGTELVADPDTDGRFGNDYIFQVIQSNGLFSLTPPIDAVRGTTREGRGVVGHSTSNDGVFGTSDASNRSGVVGINDNNVGVFGRGNARAGVLGNSSGGNGVEGDSTLGVGVLGNSRSASGVVGMSSSGTGVSGLSTSGVGTRGRSTTTDGIVGISDANGASGVVGLNDLNVGVFGQGNARAGVLGLSGTGNGVEGFSTGKGRGVYGQSTNGVGVMGLSSKPNLAGLAGFFQGRLVVVGSFVVYGQKSAAVPHPDGTHRLLYCMESPECWFEDFGEAKLVKGRAKVELEPGFASLVKTDNYHVFLTPYGASNGLYVSRRGKSEFEVAEQNDGKSNLSFSFRIAARRKDVDGKRLAKVRQPAMKFVAPPEAPALRTIEKVGKRSAKSNRPTSGS
jgi:hypothetical protein